MKTNIGDLVARDMLNVLSSKEHAQLFKKAYKVAGNCSSHDMTDCDMCGDGNMSADQDMSYSSDYDMSYSSDHDMSLSDDGPKVKKLPYMGHHFGGGHEGRSQSHRYPEKHRPSRISDFLGEDSTLEGHDLDVVESNLEGVDYGDDKLSMAMDSALQDLITASAALDYANKHKAAELSVKLAALVSKEKEKSSKKSSKKKKMPMKGGKPAFLTDEEMDVKSSKSSKKMTMKEKMQALRAKRK